MSEPRFAVLEVDSLNRLFQKIDSIEDQIQRLKTEKELPEELSIMEAAKELKLSKQRVYNLIYTHELKAVQYRRHGKVTIPREEIARYKQQNIKRK